MGYNRAMPFEVRYAIRNLLSRRGGLARLTAIAALSGVAFGVASLIVVQAIYLGFRTGIESNLLKQSAHVTVTPVGSDVMSPPVIQGKLERIPNIERVEQAIFQSSVITNEGEAAYALLRVEFRNSVPESRDHGIYLGKGLAERIGARVGSEVALVIPGADGDADVFSSKVAGLIETGLYEYDSSLVKLSWTHYVRLNSSASEHPRTYLLELRNPFEVENTVTNVRNAVGPGFSVTDWRTANRPLFTALSLERRIAAAVFVLMIVIASLGITATLVLLVNERRIDLAVLKTCGARARSLALIFLIEGIAIGGFGVAVGVLFGAVLCAMFNYFELISLPGEVYSISRLTLIQDAYTTALIAGGAFLLMLPSILVPVLRAARTKPAEILRSV